MKTDAITAALLRETKRARRKTKLGQLESLLAVRTQWQRKQTIATNKLAEVDARIRAFAVSMANDRLDADLNQP
jgi:hypothetical protein